MNKGPGQVHTYEASSLRIGILHSRWNAPIIASLVSGARRVLLSSGVPEQNIVTQSVPGSYELPLAVQRMYTASQTTSTSTLVSAATDLLGSASDLVGVAHSSGRQVVEHGHGPFDAIIAIGVLIKGSTMHFEYIADAVSHGLMRVQLDTGCPVVFGLLTCLTEEQAYTRAGMMKQARMSSGKVNKDIRPQASGEAQADAADGISNQASAVGHLSYGEQGHNHGEDWGKAAVEMAVKRRGWAEGIFIE